MRGVALWIVGLVISCAPDYAHTAFRCDDASDDPAQCPDNQKCIGGRCRRDLPGGTSDGIACTTQPPPFNQCTLGAQCCWIEGVSKGSAADCMAADQVCKGISALCDGTLDCPVIDAANLKHEYCCADGKSLFCDRQCHNYACQVSDDCPSAAPHCCRPDRGLPWGMCSNELCADVAVMPR